MNTFDKKKISTNNRIIKDPIFSPNPPNNINLEDNVITYYNGKKWKIVALDYFYYYPIIHDKYFDNTTNKNIQKVFDISITVCPFTLVSIVYFDKLGLYKNTFKGSCVFNKLDNKDLVVSFSNNKYSLELDNARSR